jgi:hypothetical protein
MPIRRGYHGLPTGARDPPCLRHAVIDALSRHFLSYVFVCEASRAQIIGVMAFHRKRVAAQQFVCAPEYSRVQAHSFIY